MASSCWSINLQTQSTGDAFADEAWQMIQSHDALNDPSLFKCSIACQEHGLAPDALPNFHAKHPHGMGNRWASSRRSNSGWI